MLTEPFGATSVEPGKVGIWGKSHVTILGFDFGLRESSPVVSVGNTMATGVTWLSDSSINFMMPALSVDGASSSPRIVEPWLVADGFIYRSNWSTFSGAVSDRLSKSISVCHPSYDIGRVCAYAGTSREMRCEELSVGFVCARRDQGEFYEIVDIDVQLGLEGNWLNSTLSVDVVATWTSFMPSTFANNAFGFDAKRSLCRNKGVYSFSSSWKCVISLLSRSRRHLSGESLDTGVHDQLHRCNH